MIPKHILLSREQINAQIWDTQIHNSRQGVIYALSWYFDIVCEQWEALVWPSATDYAITMPLPVRCKLGKRVFISRYFASISAFFQSRH